MPKWQLVLSYLNYIVYDNQIKLFGYDNPRNILNRRSNSMIIFDLEHLEVVQEENSVQGGYAFSDASASAYANGTNFAATDTRTYTNASSSSYYYYYPYSYSSASSSSGSHSSAQ